MVTALVGFPTERDELTIIDANGQHVVKIGGVLEFRAGKEDVNAEKAFIAYKQIGFPNCMIALWMPWCR